MLCAMRPVESLGAHHPMGGREVDGPYIPRVLGESLPAPLRAHQSKNIGGIGDDFAAAGRSEHVILRYWGNRRAATKRSYGRKLYRFEIRCGGERRVGGKLQQMACNWRWTDKGILAPSREDVRRPDPRGSAFKHSEQDPQELTGRDVLAKDRHGIARFERSRDLR